MGHVQTIMRKLITWAQVNSGTRSGISPPPPHFRCRFSFLNLHPNSILNNGKKEVREEEKSSLTVGLFEVFCLCFIISCVLSKCTETTNIIHSDSWQNVFSPHSWWPWKRRSVHCRSKSVQTVFLISILVSHQRFYTRWHSNNQFLTVSSLLWFCPDRDHRKAVIKIIFLSRHGRMWACARGERRSREKQGRNPILSSFFVPFCSPRVALRKKRQPLAVYIKIN